MSAEYHVTMTELRQLNIPVLNTQVGTTVYVDSIKVVISTKGVVSVYFSEDIRCCYLNHTSSGWYLELGSYAESRELFIQANPNTQLPTRLATGSDTVFFMSVLAHCLHIDVVKLLDSAMLAGTDIELSVVKLVLGQPTFYEKFGYQPLYYEEHQDFVERLRSVVVKDPNFYRACFNFYYKRMEFDYSTIDAEIMDTITEYHDDHVDIMIKYTSITDLWFYQLSYQSD